MHVFRPMANVPVKFQKNDARQLKTVTGFANTK